jgi:hypothetical protein
MLICFYIDNQYFMREPPGGPPKAGAKHGAKRTLEGGDPKGHALIKLIAKLDG